MDLHLRNTEMREEESASQIHHHAPIPGLGICLDGIPERMNGCGIDDDVQPAIGRHGAGDDGLHLVGLADVAVLDYQSQPIRLRLSTQFLVGGRIDATRDDAACAFGQALGDGAANAGSAGHNRHSVRKVSHFRPAPFTDALGGRQKNRRVTLAATTLAVRRPGRSTSCHREPRRRSSRGRPGPQLRSIFRNVPGYAQRGRGPKRKLAIACSCFNCFNDIALRFLRFGVLYRENVGLSWDFLCLPRCETPYLRARLIADESQVGETFLVADRPFAEP
jgi:hypothetical protein